MTKTKVYCKQCKYCTVRTIGNALISIGYPKYLCKLTMKTIINSIGNEIHVVPDKFCDELNADFNCKNYKETKWWWIRTLFCGY